MNEQMLNVNGDFQYIPMFACMRVMQSSIYIIIFNPGEVPGASKIICWLD